MRVLQGCVLGVVNPPVYATKPCVHSGSKCLSPSSDLALGRLGCIRRRHLGVLATTAGEDQDDQAERDNYAPQCLAQRAAIMRVSASCSANGERELIFGGIMACMSP